MKTKSQIVTEPRKTRRAPARTGAMKHRRGFAGNHSRIGTDSARDKFEHQADEAATQILRGERDVAQRLSAAPAASFKVHSSTGESLPLRIRENLEVGFGADLSEVRIHRDSASAGAAQNEHALAFTSGRDIYFGAGLYDPYSTAGLRLLIHEIAHTIQQTANIGSEGIHTSTRTGTGFIQLQDPFDEGGDQPLPATPPPNMGEQALNFIVERHRGANPADDGLEKAIEFVKTETGGALPLHQVSPAGDQIAGVATKGKLKDGSALSVAARGFLLDCLKACMPDKTDASDKSDEAYMEAATKLLDGDKDSGVRVIFDSVGLINYFSYNKNYGEEWVAKAFAHPDLKKFWPDAYIKAFQKFLFNPWSAQTEPLQDLDKEKKDALDNFGGKTGGLVFNERVVRAYQLLATLDKQRREIFKKSLEQIPEGTIATDIRLVVARRIRDWARTEKNDKANLKYRISMAGVIEHLCDDAIALWDAGGGILTTLLQQFEALDLEARFTAPSGIAPLLGGARDPAFASIRSALAEIADEGKLLALDELYDGLEIPVAQDYGDRIKALKAKFGFGGTKGIIFDLEKRVFELAMKGRLNTDLGRALGFMMVWCSFFHRLLDSYNLEEDKKTPSFADERVYHRVRVATSITQLGHAAGWPELIQTGRIVVFGEQELMPYIAIHGHWKQEDVSISEIIKDYKSGAIRFNLEGDINKPVKSLTFSAETLTVFYQTAFLNDLAKLLEQTTEKARKENRFPDLESAVKGIATIQKPRRYRPDGYEVVGSPKERKKSVAEFLNNNKKTQAETKAWADKEKLGPLWVYSYPPVDLEDVFVWIFPDLTPLINALKVPYLKELVAKTQPGILSDLDWIEVLLSVAKPQDLLAPLRVDLGNARERVARDFRQITTLERLSISRKINEQLKKYADDPSVVNFEIPGKVIKQIEDFHYHVLPELDMMPQTAALMLSIAANLKSAFGDATDATMLPSSVWDFLEIGIQFAEGAKDKDDKAGQFKHEALAAVLYKDPADATKSEFLSELIKHKQDLTDVRTNLRDARKNLQERFGFKSADGISLQSLVYYPKLLPGKRDLLEIDNEDWELVRVHRPFVYHPALNRGVGATTKPLLKDESGAVTAPQSNPLLTFLRNGEEYIVKENDAPALELLSKAVEGKTLQYQLENLAEATQQAMMLTIDVLELVPGVGQELMAARVMTQVVQFMGSEEFNTIVLQIKDDPLKFIKENLLNLAEKYLTAEKLISFVLLGGANPFKELRSPTKARASTKGPPTGKLGRLVQFMRRLGALIADGLQWLKLHIQSPLRAIQSFIITRPRLVWLIEQAVKVIQFVLDIIPDDIKEFVSHIIEDGLSFKTRIVEFLEGLREVELPEEVLPLDLAMSAILDFVVSRMGVKVRLVKKVLDAVGMTDKIVKVVNDELLRRSILDPNNLWRERVIPEIEDGFRTGRNELIRGVYTLFFNVAETTGIKELALSQPDLLPQGQFKLTKTRSAEAELSPTTSVLPSQPETADLPLTGGQPLGVLVRLRQEQRFGHDLGHVRLHTGPEAQEPTSLLAADGITSGSHVFLRPGLSPTDGKGAKILAHELTHVLQQTGPRPLGRSHDERPVRGKPGVGIRFDQAREAAADMMARSARGVATEPVDVGGQAEGLQPSFMIDPFTVGRVLETFLTFQTAPQFQKGVTRDVPGKAEAQQVWKTLLARLEKKETKDFRPFLQSVIPEVVEQVKHADVESRLMAVADFAQVVDKSERGKPPKTKLDLKIFKNLLEMAIFGLSGLSMHITLADKKPEVEKLDVAYLHLGSIPPSSKSGLWNRVMDNSTKIIAGDDKNKLRMELHQRLKAVGPLPFIWDINKPDFKFSQTFIDEFVKYRVKGTKTAGLESKIPKKGEYLVKSGQKGVGLRIGTHGGQEGTDRESHHTTQYLLVQFFRNKNNQLAWEDKKDYPESPDDPAKTKKGRTDFKAKKGTLQLQSLDTAESVRGKDMPAILISADLHKRGELHVEREKVRDQNDDEGDDGRSSQGFAIHNEFRRNLREKFSIDDRDADWNKRVKKDNDSSNHIYDAMTETYRWMHRRMLPQLKAGLVKRELAYYRSIASRLYTADPNTGKLQQDYDLTDTDMIQIGNDAKKNNDDVMRAAGWYE
ncbi:MAG: DUF4157 domain-containing protein [Blastocatellia bacterium]